MSSFFPVPSFSSSARGAQGAQGAPPHAAGQESPTPMEVEENSSSQSAANSQQLRDERKSDQLTFQRYEKFQSQMKESVAVRGRWAGREAAKVARLQNVSLGLNDFSVIHISPLVLALTLAFFWSSGCEEFISYLNLFLPAEGISLLYEYFLGDPAKSRKNEPVEISFPYFPDQKYFASALKFSDPPDEPSSDSSESPTAHKHERERCSNDCVQAGCDKFLCFVCWQWKTQRSHARHSCKVCGNSKKAKREAMKKAEEAAKKEGKAPENKILDDDDLIELKCANPHCSTTLDGKGGSGTGRKKIQPEIKQPEETTKQPAKRARKSRAKEKPELQPEPVAKDPPRRGFFQVPIHVHEREIQMNSIIRCPQCWEKGKFPDEIACRRCNQLLPLGVMKVDSNAKTGIRPVCKKCHSAFTNEYHRDLSRFWVQFGPIKVTGHYFYQAKERVMAMVEYFLSIGTPAENPERIGGFCCSNPECPHVGPDWLERILNGDDGLLKTLSAPEPFVSQRVAMELDGVFLLQCDHIDTSKKTNTPNKIKNLSDLMKELPNLRPLCIACHRRRSYNPGEQSQGKLRYLRWLIVSFFKLVVLGGLCMGQTNGEKPKYCLGQAKTLKETCRFDLDHGNTNDKDFSIGNSVVSGSLERELKRPKADDEDFVEIDSVDPEESAEISPGGQSSPQPPTTAGIVDWIKGVFQEIFKCRLLCVNCHYFRTCEQFKANNRAIFLLLAIAERIREKNEKEKSLNKDGQ